MSKAKEVPKEPPQPGFVKCHYCHGTGQVTYHGAELAVTCEACGGSGTLARSSPR